MLAVKRCSSCGRDVALGEGIMLVRNDGTVHYYCSSKCRKNALILRRDARRFKWASRPAKGGG